MALIRRAGPGEFAPSAPPQPAVELKPISMRRADPGEEESVFEPVYKSMEIAFFIVFGLFLAAIIGISGYMLLAPHFR